MVILDRNSEGTAMFYRCSVPYTEYYNRRALHAHKTKVSIHGDPVKLVRTNYACNLDVYGITKANFVAFYCFEIGSAAIRALFATPFIRVSSEGRAVKDKALAGIARINNLWRLLCSFTTNYLLQPTAM